jgi:hypothetical protein
MIPTGMATSHLEIINRWPTIRAFADAIGVEYNTAKHIRRRRAIPARHWAALVDAAPKSGIKGITLKVLADAAKRPTARRASLSVASQPQQVA